MQANLDGSPAEAGVVTLDNCDSEPIQAPGHVQPHGALFAFDTRGVLTHRSSNAEAMLGEMALPSFGETLSPRHFAGMAGFHQLATRIGDKPQDGTLAEIIPETVEVEAAGGVFDLVVHRTATHLVCEFEQRAGAAPLPDDFVADARRAIERLKRQKTVQTLLNVAVQAVRALTGFDRVMAYRFRHDDSGEVVAESVEADLGAFLGQRYPAGDIPQQARRLYILNTLRLIADVGAVRVPVKTAMRTAPPLDMSYGVLRSVSPIHLEYLSNMGVAASMSVSIVIEGKLWGMLACHHRQPRRVAYVARMACDTVAQILAAHLQGALAMERSSRADGYGGMRARLVGAVRGDADVLVALTRESGALMEAFGAHAVVFAQGPTVRVETAVPGHADQGMGSALIRWLNTLPPADLAPHGMLVLDSLLAAPPEVREPMAGWAGVLALPFGNAPSNWVVLLRKEEIQTIRWGGKPEKVYKPGPSGPRLTPRGSFDLWKETVRDKAVPWDESAQTSAQKLLDDLMRADVMHASERDKARGEMLAMLGSDLRQPLQTILNAAIELKATGSDPRIGERLHTTAARMKRLVGKVVDVSRMQTGAMLHLQTGPTDLCLLLRQALAEAQEAHPHMRIQPLLPHDLVVEIDAERIAQAIGHLLSNAGQHGAADEPVLVELRDLAGTTVLEISNCGQAIAEATAVAMFLPFQPLPMRAGLRAQRVGVGLYIAHQIVENHGGSLSYTFAEPYVVFSMVLPPTLAVAVGGKKAVPRDGAAQGI